MSRIQRWHVETACVILIIAGIIVLHTAILPRTPEDAFQTTKSSHAAYEGRLTGEQPTESGYIYRGNLCKTVQVWSAERLPTNTPVTVTGEMNQNTLFASTTTKR